MAENVSFQFPLEKSGVRVYCRLGIQGSRIEGREESLLLAACCLLLTQLTFPLSLHSHTLFCLNSFNSRVQLTETEFLQSAQRIPHSFFIAKLWLESGLNPKLNSANEA